MSTTYAIAREYYPEIWNKNRLKGLVKLNLLTVVEFETITGESYNTPDETEEH